MKKIINIILIIFFFGGCATKKTFIKYKDKIVKDSIYITKDRYITKQVNDTITIQEVCDTLGNLKNFDRVIKTDNAKVSIKSVNGSIQATVNIDSIVNSKVSEFKQNYKQEKEIIIEEVVRYKTPFWMWITIILETLIIVLLLKLKF